MRSRPCWPSFKGSEHCSEYRRSFRGAQRWPQTGSTHLPLGERVGQEKQTAPALAGFILHLLKLCLCEAEHAPRQGHETHSFELSDPLPTERGQVPLFWPCQLAGNPSAGCCCCLSPKDAVRSCSKEL